MKISGFTMVKNAGKLYYPIKPAIESALPIVDEFIIALGDCDQDDDTREQIERIGNSKIKIIDSPWDIEKYPRGMENAHQTDIAKSHCNGDWLLYLQADEVLHEEDLPTIRERCEEYLNNQKVEGFLFNYYHFWGDYQHIHQSHGWYRNEIRIIRNDPDIHSWKSAQSFRRIPDFDGLHYRQKKGTEKLKVVPANAHIYHYGWVRPPKLMKKKSKALDTVHKGVSEAEKAHLGTPDLFHYGPINKLSVFKGTHPKVMQPWIEKFDWAEQLDYEGEKPLDREKFKHERTKYRILSKIENILGIPIGGTKNYKMVKR